MWRVVQLLQQARGPDAALAELDRLIAANQGQPTPPSMARCAPRCDFEGGKQDEAIAEMEAILQRRSAVGRDPQDQADRWPRCLPATGNRVGARARVEEVLAEDASNVEALKMRAAWLIDEDKPGDAILALRTALTRTRATPIS